MKAGTIIIGIFVIVIVVSGGLFFLSGDKGKSIDVNPNGISIDEAGSSNGFDNVDENNEAPPIGTIDDDVQPESEPPPIGEQEEPEPITHPLQFNGGYEPNTLTINQGDSVIFTNEDSSTTTWPASVIHPTHVVYPGSSISKCGTDEESTIFDACKGLAEGESYTFTFNEVGTWRYHDHLRPSKTGTIIVE